MIGVPSGVKVLVATQFTDRRKAHDGLARLVQDELKQNVFSGHLFVFFNRKANRVKLLYWDSNGYCLWYKRLEKGQFIRPRTQGKVYSLSAGELSLLLEGVDLTTRRFKRVA